MKLNIGCRDDVREGYFNLDLYYQRDGVIKEDCITLRSFGKGCADEVLALSVLEHFNFDEAQRAMQRWFEILKPGGKVIIKTPDLAYLFELYHDRGGIALRRMFGPQDDAGQFHKSGWDFELLGKFLMEIGFSKVEITECEDDDLMVQAIK